MMIIIENNDELVECIKLKTIFFQSNGVSTDTAAHLATLECTKAPETKTTEKDFLKEKFIDVGIDLFTVGFVGLGVGFGCRKLFQRSRGLNSIVIKSKDILKGSKPFVSRGDIGALTKDVKKVIILKGPHRSGKTSLVAHIMSNERYPWYMRTLFPAHGFMFKWDGKFTDTKSWMQSQLSAENSGDPLFVIDELRVKRSNRQYFRKILYKVFHDRLPDVMRPQPLIVVFDQAEELIGRLGADFVDYVNELTKTACDQPQSLQLFFIVNTDNAVKSLLSLNGGNRFLVVDVPKPSVEAVSDTMGKRFSEEYEDVDCIFGVAKDYLNQLDRGDIVEPPGASRQQLKAMRADFAETQKKNYEKTSVVNEPVTQEMLMALQVQYKGIFQEQQRQ